MDRPADLPAGELLDNARATLLALSEDTLAQPRVDRWAALELSQGVTAAFARYAAAASTEFTPERAASIMEAAGTLVGRARVYEAADDHAESPVSEPERERRVELAKRNRGNDRYLFKWLWALFEGEQELQAQLEDIRHGRGKRDDAQDVLREVELFRQHWARAAGRTPVSVADLEAAEQSAREQLRLLEEQSLEHEGSPLDLRRRAYTHWHQAYDLVIRAGRYLAWQDPDAEKLFPGLHA